jgi:hypothetical protein
VSTLCTTPAKGMHPGHTVNIIHSFIAECSCIPCLVPSARRTDPVRALAMYAQDVQMLPLCIVSRMLDMDTYCFQLLKEDTHGKVLICIVDSTVDVCGHKCQALPT